MEASCVTSAPPPEAARPIHHTTGELHASFQKGSVHTMQVGEHPIQIPALTFYTTKGGAPGTCMLSPDADGRGACLNTSEAWSLGDKEQQAYPKHT